MGASVKWVAELDLDKTLSYIVLKTYIYSFGL